MANTNAPDPGLIFQVGFGFFASKTLLSAVELDLFTFLDGAPRRRAEIEAALGLHPRASRDFLDALVALGLLAREGEGDAAAYANTRDTATFLSARSPAYVGGLHRMANQRLYPSWAGLTESLRTGLPRNELAATGRSPFDAIYADPAGLEGFLRAMAGVSLGPSMAFAEKFDFSGYRSLVDAGGATGVLSIAVARRHPHVRATTVDLPAVEPIARRAIEEAGVADRVSAASCDFFREPLPKADVVVMGQILHDWGLDEKKRLVRAAYDALPPGGAFVAIDSILDDARRENAFGLLMSLNMLLETPAGFDYSGADFAAWCHEIGFSSVRILPLAGPMSAGIAIK